MSYRIIELPPALCPTGQSAIAALIQRDQENTPFALLWIAKNYSLTGAPPDTYSLLQTYLAFAKHGVLTADYTDQTLCIDTRIGAKVLLDGPDTIFDEVTDTDGLAGAYLVFIDNEILFLLQPTMGTPGAYSLPLVRGQNGTAVQYHNKGADVYILKATDLIVLPMEVKSGMTAKFKVTLGQQSVSEQDETDITFAGVSSTPAAISSLSLNGALTNAPYDVTHDFAIAWQLPNVPGVDLSKSYTLLEFIVASVVVYSVKVAWPATSLTYTYPTTHPASLFLRATFVVFNGWETIKGPSVQLYAFQASSS